MPNIYLEVTIEKKWGTQNFDFLNLRSSSPGQFLGNSNSCRYHWIFKLLVATWKTKSLGAKVYYFWKNYDNVLKSNSLWFLMNQNINFNKTRWNRKWKIQHTVLERWTLCFSSYKNYELKVKLWLVGARQRQKRSFVTFILSEENFFNICVLHPCKVFWINFQSIYTFI